MATLNAMPNTAFVGTDALKKRYIHDTRHGDKEIVLAIEGISCAGCIPGLEVKIRSITGVKSAAINHSNFRASIVWDPKKIDAEDLLQLIQGFGYTIRPYQSLQQERAIGDEKKLGLTRLFVALACGMQVMMITVALYFGEAMGMEDRYRHALRYAAMLLTLPVLLVSARPFFENAWQGIKRRSLNVDLPVALALALAFCGSALATFGYEGQVYYESVVMFVVLLLSARYLETVARHKGIAAISEMEKSMPEVATRIDSDGHRVLVDVNELQPGDRIVVLPGALVPADGEICIGESSLNESIVTGESLPVSKQKGDFVIAGSVNVQNVLTVEIQKPIAESLVNNLVNITTHAQFQKSRVSRFANKLAGHFVWGVLLIALLTAIYWWFQDPSLWLPVVISTLVVACPCALSLATPTAFVAAMSNLTRQGVLPITSDFLERFSEVDHIIFDKTGTLTTGDFSVSKIDVVPEISEVKAVAIARALNQDSRHPIAQGLNKLPNALQVSAKQIRYCSGGGVTGQVEDKQWTIGSPRFVARETESAMLPLAWDAVAIGSSTCVLACDNKVVARFELVDTVRPEAASVIEWLKRQKISLSVYSGDEAGAVNVVATRLGIDDFRGGLLPQEKLRLAEKLKQQGKRIAVVGDGLNDAPLLAAASVSVAMGQGADLSKITSDVVLTKNNLSALPGTMRVGEKTKIIIQQNYTWAAVYNLLAIPAAIFGLVPPWAAALGMSTSSLIVSANSLRLLKKGGSSNTSDHKADALSDQLVTV